MPEVYWFIERCYEVPSLEFISNRLFLFLLLSKNIAVVPFTKRREKGESKKCPENKK
jgi:hypothetical protein